MLLAGLRREEHQLPGCQEVLRSQDDVSQSSSSSHASGLAVTLARPDVISSRGPAEREDASLEARRPGCPYPSCHQGPGLSHFVSEMSYLV